MNTVNTKYLEAVRRKRLLTQGEVCSLAGISRDSYARLIRNQHAGPVVLRKLCVALELDRNKLIKGGKP